MKVYRNNILEPVNSVQRKPESIIVPPFYFKGRLKTGKSGFWPVNTRMAIEGATVTMTEPGTTIASFALLKDNLFYFNTCTSTATTAGRSRTMALPRSPLWPG